MKVYISGPMTGMPELNFPAFNLAAEQLRAAGYVVVNPVEVNDGHSSEWGDCMRNDIRALMDCDTVALLPGWQASRGANLERHIAQELGMTVLEVEDLLLASTEQ